MEPGSLKYLSQCLPPSVPWSWHLWLR